MLLAAVQIIPLAIIIERPWTIAPSAASAWSVLYLGLFPTGLAAIIYFHLIAARGATYLSLSNYAVPALGVIYWALTAFLILRRILVRTSRVTADTVNGAICVYLVMGLGWSHAYALLEAVHPGSFELGGGVALEGAHYVFERFIGFSFVTLTTLGYGNVIPLTPKSEALAVAEAITGQLYLAVLLARLVAMEIVGRRAE